MLRQALAVAGIVVEVADEQHRGPPELSPRIVSSASWSPVEIFVPALNEAVHGFVGT